MQSSSLETSALQTSAVRFLAQQCSFARHRQRQPGVRLDRALWRQLGEMGWLGVMLSEESGGLGQSPREALTLVEAMGAQFVAAPYAPALAAAQLLQAAGSAEQRARWLPSVCDGSALLLLAHAEAGSGHALPCVQTRASAVADGYLLSGSKCTLPWGDDADALLISARLGGALDDEDGIALFMVEPGSAGLHFERREGIAGEPLVDVRLDRLWVPGPARLEPAGGALAGLSRAHDLLLAADCAEAVGTLEAVLQATRDYARTRHQFGAPLSSFQVIAHRLVDLFIQVQLARSMAQLAATLVCVPAPEPQQRAQLSACKAQVSAACRFVGEQAVQIHGGIGMTDELALSHQVRRLLALERSRGDRFHHLGVLTDGVMQGTGLYV